VSISTLAKLAVVFVLLVGWFFHLWDVLTDAWNRTSVVPPLLYTSAIAAYFLIELWEIIQKILTAHSTRKTSNIKKRSTMVRTRVAATCAVIAMLYLAGIASVSDGDGPAASVSALLPSLEKAALFRRLGRIVGEYPTSQSPSGVSPSPWEQISPKNFSTSKNPRASTRMVHTAPHPNLGVSRPSTTAERAPVPFDAYNRQDRILQPTPPLCILPTMAIILMPWTWPICFHNSPGWTTTDAKY
jgi:hypothetical protein